MRRCLTSVAAVTLLLAVAAAPAAGQPTRTVIDIGTPADEADYAAQLTAACGFAVQADVSGRVIAFERERGRISELSVYHIQATFTNVATGKTTRLVDVGPDQRRIDRRTGAETFAIIGRSTTGSGVIGRVVFVNDEIVFEAGRPYGDWREVVCAQLA